MDIMVEFIMYAEEFPVESVLEQIGIPCSKKIEKGDILLIGPDKNIPRLQEGSSITYSTGYIETLNVEGPIRKMFDILSPKIQIIGRLVEIYGLYAKFCVVINLTDNPIIIFSKEFIDLASAIHAKIEIDSYVDYDKEGKPLCNKKGNGFN